MRSRAGMRPAQSPTSSLRLPPLPHSPSATSLANVDNGRSPLPGCRAQSPAGGHLGALRGLRRSAPAAPVDWWLRDSPYSNNLSRSSRRMAELVEPVESNSPSQPRKQKDVRVRRVRQPADVGTRLGWGSRNRGHSCAGTVGEAKSHQSDVSEEGAQRMARCSSIPAIGTSQADEKAVAQAKMTAVATLQRLFFEEMSKGGVEANDAAARALLRLSEAPSLGSSSACDVLAVRSTPESSADTREVVQCSHDSQSGKQRCVPWCPAPSEGHRLAQAPVKA